MGVAGNLGPRDNLMFNILLELDVIRGRDSAGVMIKNSKGCEIYKEVEPPWYGLYWNEDYLEARKDSTNCILLGHNRAATVGSVDKSSAHPFNYQHIYGAHNGTLTRTNTLEDGDSFTVDSQAIFNHLSVHGVDDTVRNLIGAFALTWYDEQDNTINFVRNNQRPLFFAFSTDEQSLFWASESWMLVTSAKKAKVNLKTIFEVKPLHHYKIEVPDKSANLVADRKFGKFRLRRLVPWEYTGYNYPNNTRYIPRQQGNIFNTHKQTNKNVMSNFHRNKEISFIIRSVVMPGAGDAYIRAESVVHPGVEVRLFPKIGTKSWVKYCDVGARFTGNIKAVKKGYVLIKISSIKKSGTIKVFSQEQMEREITEKDTKIYRVGSGLVNEATFERYIKDGCGVCSREITKEQESILDWWHDTPICPNCSIDDVITC